LSDNSLTIVLPQIEAQQFDTISVPVTVTNFTNISGFQFTIEWDPTVIQLVGTTEHQLSYSYGYSFVNDGKLAGLWSTENLNGYSLPNGSVIMNIQFIVIGQTGTYSPLQFNSSVTALEAYDNELGVMNIFVTNGNIYSGQITSEPAITQSNQFFNCYPNPFGELTSISFNLHVSQFVSIEIFDVCGKKVKDLSGYFHSGKNIIQWHGTAENGETLSNGTYFCRILTTGFSGTEKIVLMK